MESQVREYVKACPVMRQEEGVHRTTHGTPATTAHSLQTMGRHLIGLGTGLPVFKGNTTVLTVVDRFSKMTRLIALPKLPSAKEIAAIMINHVFRIHGFPWDIVSDRGPQFVLCFWRKFCRLIGVTVSLTSGYHPESNGQTERLNQQLETGLLCLVSQNPLTWRKHLVWVKT